MGAGINSKWLGIGLEEVGLKMKYDSVQCQQYGNRIKL